MNKFELNFSCLLVCLCQTSDANTSIFSFCFSLSLSVWLSPISSLAVPRSSTVLARKVPLRRGECTYCNALIQCASALARPLPRTHCVRERSERTSNVKQRPTQLRKTNAMNPVATERALSCCFLVFLPIGHARTAEPWEVRAEPHFCARKRHQRERAPIWIFYPSVFTRIHFSLMSVCAPHARHRSETVCRRVLQCRIFFLTRDSCLSYRSILSNWQLLGTLNIYYTLFVNHKSTCLSVNIKL